MLEGKSRGTQTATKTCEKDSSNTDGIILSQQYGGIHARGWVDRLPAPWIPYVQLSRLSPPAALLLIYFPHLFGVLHAASVHKKPLGDVAYASLVLLGGSFFCNNASHAWNDLIDAPIDMLISRTKKRPIPRGAITRRAAFLFTITQALGAMALLLFLPRDTAVVTLPNIAVTTYYPYAKRHTHLPQLVLAFCLSWGVFVGSSALGVDSPWRDPSALCLFAVSIAWVVIFDTIYAHQDIDDDTKYGVKSMAVLLQNRAKSLLWSLSLCMSFSLLLSGYLAQMGPSYYLLTVGASTWSVVAMVAKVDLQDPTSCWLWFSKGFLLTGAAMVSGLMLEYGERSRYIPVWHEWLR
ncbi:putative family protein [Rosellinia necatrix]|uniref:Putative family protein n=1 Tax=Rosellinia necatrix TaxID=77044 RepID=A0A1S7UP17_ROSNE|nr:putative family protein [Rosellinia necatrix]